jgi:hypothetical protein
MVRRTGNPRVTRHLAARARAKQSRTAEWHDPVIGDEVICDGKAEALGVKPFPAVAVVEASRARDETS